MRLWRLGTLHTEGGNYVHGVVKFEDGNFFSLKQVLNFLATCVWCSPVYTVPVGRQNQGFRRGPGNGTESKNKELFGASSTLCSRVPDKDF